MIKTFFIALQCSTTFFDGLEIKPRQDKIILRIPLEMVKISGDFSTITFKLAERNVISEDSSTSKKEYVENKKNIQRIYCEKESSTTHQGMPYGIATT